MHREGAFLGVSVHLKRYNKSEKIDLYPNKKLSLLTKKEFFHRIITILNNSAIKKNEGGSLFMDNTKIEIRIGEIQFIGEGNPSWLEKQLDKILNKTELLSKISNAVKNKDNSASEPAIEPTIKEISSQPLVAFLRSKNATSNQVLKFLATSVWLESKGKKRLKTSDVTAALKDANQSRIGNPADCLGKNITKGLCEREGNEYFVTNEGKVSLGL